MPTQRIRIADAIGVGGGAPLALIAGPDLIENEAHALKMASALAEIARQRDVP
ncbi:MAG: 3-deoxy-8-phosphooctulonate synthase, partial [Actinobacteria bacterium]|nr:3-deoxy-8-phosphooctulonate synthase [Actinomycetota bacterium]